MKCAEKQKDDCVMLNSICKHFFILFLFLMTIVYIISTPFVFSLLSGNYSNESVTHNLHGVNQAVLLGGYVKYLGNDYVEVDFNDQIDRVLKAADLYKTESVNEIIICAGPPVDREKTRSHGEEAYSLLRSLGIPEDSMQISPFASNTYYESIVVSEMINNKERPIALITSAWHMERAKKTFEGRGFNVVPVYVDLPVKETFAIKSLVPIIDVFVSSIRALREFIGDIYYRIMGYY